MTRFPAPDSLDDLRPVLSSWLEAAQESCVPSEEPELLEWLGGRIRTLIDVVSLLDGEIDASGGWQPPSARTGSDDA
jgi:hypothetical protein